MIALIAVGAFVLKSSLTDHFQMTAEERALEKKCFKSVPPDERAMYEKLPLEQKKLALQGFAIDEKNREAARKDREQIQKSFTNASQKIGQALKTLDTPKDYPQPQQQAQQVVPTPFPVQSSQIASAPQAVVDPTPSPTTTTYVQQAQQVLPTQPIQQTQQVLPTQPVQQKQQVLPTISQSALPSERPATVTTDAQQSQPQPKRLTLYRKGQFPRGTMYSMPDLQNLVGVQIQQPSYLKGDFRFISRINPHSYRLKGLSKVPFVGELLVGSTEFILNFPYDVIPLSRYFKSDSSPTGYFDFFSNNELPVGILSVTKRDDHLLVQLEVRGYFYDQNGSPFPSM